MSQLNISTIEVIKRTTCSMNLMFLTEKKIRSPEAIFDVEIKSTLKSKILSLLKFSFSEKNTKFHSYLPIVLTNQLILNVKTNGS